jgi:DNA-binding IclR family transcriptional regulator
LSTEEARFVEDCGLFFERLGLPRIGGRILALLMIADEPMSLEELSTQLKVSKASVSTNTRRFEALGLLDVVTRLGDRRTYFQWSPRAWERRFELGLKVSAALAHFADSGLRCLHPSDHVARARLEEAGEFATYMNEQVQRVRAGWEKRRGRR